jgi:hypothetical protein
MSEFLKLAYELIAKILYNIVACFAAIFNLFIGGWTEYILIFRSYFGDLNLFSKFCSILLVVILTAIPVCALLLIVRRSILHIQLKADKEDNKVLYKEIGRLNRQVLELIDEKNKILALKVNTMGGTERIPYMGASALADDTIPTVGNVVGGAAGNTSAGTVPVGAAVAIDTAEAVPSSEASAESTAAAQPVSVSNMTVLAEHKAMMKEREQNTTIRFPKLTQVDEKYREYERPEFNDEISLEEFVENYRLFAASQLHLYYTPEIVRRFVAGMAASKILILEGISGTGKTSLPYSFSRFLCNPATMVSVQPSFRDRTELLGYFNEFSKRFNETEFLRALYEANYREDPSFIVLDEMNLARIEYYFAEMLSVLEMPSHDEWLLDLVPTAWAKDPEKLENGKIHISDTMWYVGTANNDDSTFTITDKVYDRAIPIEINERADAFECDLEPSCPVTCTHLQELFAKAKEEHPISEATLSKMKKMDEYLQTRFKLAFGNRIMKQMYDFIPVYVACGGTELDGMDYILARKVLKKFESLNVSFVRDEIKGLIEYMEKTFGKSHMRDSISYLQRIQNLY